MVQTDVCGSSGAVNSNGTLIQTGGYHDGESKYGYFHRVLMEKFVIGRNFHRISPLKDGILRIIYFQTDVIIREFPIIPGEKRTYPATGSSVMLPMKLAAGDLPTVVEVMVCGGANGGAFLQAERGGFMPASRTCGRMRITDPEPEWVMEDMPLGRVIPDMLLLPTGDVIILNGASKDSRVGECN
ncbi:hypothetical protein HAX54_033186 [Datura stramonium]|uniref:Glyoxal oxidase N-terminal domain-containing protein n=1 Tax=Datura stramonium TaxID=4076 RepID=A0ABS8VE68_DATST|nr:hypothetical protein [Datura stramonium]